jgi:hypothetical protein
VLHVEECVEAQKIWANRAIKEGGMSYIVEDECRDLQV